MIQRDLPVFPTYSLLAMNQHKASGSGFTVNNGIVSVYGLGLALCMASASSASIDADVGPSPDLGCTPGGGAIATDSESWSGILLLVECKQAVGRKTVRSY
jgi:hypothetical protein